MKKSVSPRSRGGFFSPAVNVIVVLSLLFGWYACAEPEDIGLDLIDEEASFFTTDTISLSAYTIPDDSLPTNLGAQNLLGMMHDPVFGQTRASMFTEIRLPQNNLSLGEDPVLDSIRLSIAYTGRYYGDTLTFQNIKVYELSENFPEQDTLYTTNFVEHYPEPIGSLNLLPGPIAPIMIDTITELPAHFIIPLSNEFGQKILDANNTEYFENIPNFLEYFKGLYITVEDDFDEGGAIFNISPGSTYTTMQLYYRLEDDTVSRLQNFYISEFANRITHVENFDYTEAHPLLQAQLQGQTEYGDSLLFLKSLGGLRANIDIPFLETQSQERGLAINRARFIVAVEDMLVDEDFFPPAERLLIFRYNEEGEMEPLSDFQIGSSYFGGIYDAEDQTYTFNITSYIQEVLNGQVEYHGLALVVSGAAENARRVVLKGPGRTQNPMRIELIYTVFD